MASLKNVLDPQQRLFWELYIDPESETFSNITRSGVKAGYSFGYSEQIGKTYWFQGLLRRHEMRASAEKVLKEMIEMEDTVELMGVDGRPTGIKRKEPALTKIKQDTAKFVSERLGKDDWATRNELTGKDGEALPTPILASMNPPDAPSDVPNHDGDPENRQTDQA